MYLECVLHSFYLNIPKSLIWKKIFVLYKIIMFQISVKKVTRFLLIGEMLAKKVNAILTDFKNATLG